MKMKDLFIFCALRNDDYGIHDSNYDLIEHVYSGSDLSGSQRPN